MSTITIISKSMTGNVFVMSDSYSCSIEKTTFIEHQISLSLQKILLTFPTVVILSSFFTKTGYRRAVGEVDQLTLQDQIRSWQWRDLIWSLNTKATWWVWPNAQSGRDLKWYVLLYNTRLTEGTNLDMLKLQHSI